MSLTPLEQYRQRMQTHAGLIKLVEVLRGEALAELSDAQQVCPHTVTHIRIVTDIAFDGVGEFTECLHCGATNFVTRELDE